MYIYYIILLYFIVLYHFISLYCIVLHSMSCHDVILVLYIYCIILCFIAWCYNTPLRVFIYRIIHIILYIRYIIQYNIYIHVLSLEERWKRCKVPQVLASAFRPRDTFSELGSCAATVLHWALHGATPRNCLTVLVAVPKWGMNCQKKTMLIAYIRDNYD